MAAQARWDHDDPSPRPALARVSGTKTDPDRTSARIVSVIALASIAAGAINVAAAATIGRGNAQNLAFFVAASAGQIIWGAVALVRAPRRWLALGAVGNLLVVATWVLSRTVGLPLGPESGITLPVGFADALATALAAVTVLGAAALLARGRAPARSASRSWGVTAAAVVLLGALALAGVLSQTNASGSTPGGSGGNGGGGVSGPYAPGGGGSSGGGSSGGGPYGY
jgi:hypothetical protein